MSNDAVSLQPDPSTPLQYHATADNAPVTLIPFYKNHQNYAVYWNTGPALYGTG